MKHLYRRVYTYYDFYLKRGIPATLAKYFSIKEKTKFFNVDNFYKGKFPSLSDFFISLHTLARGIFASMPKLPKYYGKCGDDVFQKSQVDETVPAKSITINYDYKSYSKRQQCV